VGGKNSGKKRGHEDGHVAVSVNRLRSDIKSLGKGGERSGKKSVEKVRDDSGRDSEKRGRRCRPAPLEWGLKGGGRKNEVDDTKSDVKG